MQEFGLEPKIRKPLSRARVLKSAMKLADREGLPALSMRRLGKELGVEAMSLYHHLPGKDGLLDGLAEALSEEIIEAVAARPPEALKDWKADLRSRCLAAREVALRHPWTPALFASRRSIPAGLLLHVDRIVALLIGAGFSHRITHRALHALSSLMFGFAQELFSPPASGGKLDAAENEAQFAKIAELLPHLSAMIAAEMHHASDPSLGWCDTQTEFEFTLDLMIDGLERIKMESVRQT